MTDSITPSDDLESSLLLGAEGTYRSEAATELLIRSGLLSRFGSWVDRDPDGLYAWVDWDGLALQLPRLGLSSGERRIVSLALSIATSFPIVLGELAGIDDRYSELAVTALAHVFGWQEQRKTVPISGIFSDAGAVIT